MSLLPSIISNASAIVEAVNLLALGSALPTAQSIVQPQRSITLQIADATGGGGLIARRQAGAPSALQLRAGVLPQPAPSSTPSVPNATLTFDITASPDGWAQRFDYGVVSRQSEQASGIGFHVNEWGVGIAPISLDVVVSLVGNPPDAVEKFFAAFYAMKRTSPMSDERPKVVRLLDAYTGRKYRITVRSLKIALSVEDPNMAHLRLDAGILSDYNNATAAPAPPAEVAGVSDVSDATNLFFVG